jgi:hypothetical protein
MQSEEDKAEVVRLKPHLEKHQNQCLALIDRKDTEVGRVLQKDERNEIKNAAESSNSAPYQAEKSCEERETPIHRLKHLEDEQGRADVESGRNEESCGPGAKQHFVGQKVGGGGRGIAYYRELAANEQGIEAREKTHQPAKPTHPRLEERRHG